ncbi:uncharacterized protein TM35_000171980 [Trypanosoma theileri]|uniref:Methyltransferase domain-containing protein n=1 Tax=Trypanosoma theileri TaxID=67003 RepID=A0A1X0NUE1_9TRYP|nr:uncharacterized protein TM35_000171980 [Trypanosoma theileri]ORC88326.1 hypothetical protein TM35_000171980 [Trypanosoma theileri]
MQYRMFFRRPKNKKYIFKYVVLAFLTLLVLFLILTLLTTDRSVSVAVVSPLKPWGYNKERNVQRISAVRNSIYEDIYKGILLPTKTFTVVDYGSDQGYFSINLAVMFPNAHVMSVELGGVGGEIWKKRGDVLVLQDKLINEHDVGKRVQICQTMIVPNHFTLLNNAGLGVDYQLVLSVFHWFDLKDKVSFQKVLVSLLQNANIATFIELPVLGDDSAMIRKQVGYQNFKKWYEGTGGNIGKVIEEALLTHNLTARIVSIAKVPWINWYRELYRVELLDVNSRKNLPFNCEKRREIYGCKKRTVHDKCTT